MITRLLVLNMVTPPGTGVSMAAEIKKGLQTEYLQPLEFSWLGD